jgi:flagellar protein FlaG
VSAAFLSIGIAVDEIEIEGVDMSEISNIGLPAAPPRQAVALATAPPAKSEVATAEKPDVISEVPRPHIQPIKKIDAITLDPEEIRLRLEEAIKALSEKLEAKQSGLSFRVDERLGRSIVMVTSKQTGEVIRQIPGEAVLRVANSIESLKGILFDDVF